MPLGDDSTGIHQVNLVLVQMLFLDLTLGTLARYSLKLHFPSKFVVRPLPGQIVSFTTQKTSCSTVHIMAHHIVVLYRSSWLALCCNALRRIVWKMHCALSGYGGVHALQQVLSLQVSQSGRFVATFFQHTVFVYSTERPAMAPLKLYHTRVFTVSCSHWQQSIM